MQQVRAALEQLPYNANDVYLHTDASLMPRDRAVWASWNVIGSSGSGDAAAVCVTYWANRLQVRLPAPVQMSQQQHGAAAQRHWPTDTCFWHTEPASGKVCVLKPGLLHTS